MVYRESPLHGASSSVTRSLMLGAVTTIVCTVHGSLLLDSSLGLNEVAWHSEPSKTYLGSPSILRLKSGDLLVTADRFGSGWHGQPNASVYRSQDNGTTWKFETWVISQYWSNLFQIDPTSDTVYMMGTNSSGPSAAKIAQSKDGGVTWDPADSCIIATGTAGEYSHAGFETGPTPALVASDGRLYRAVELMPPPAQWPKSYQAVMLSADASSNLLDATNWRVSAPLPFNTSWLPSAWGTLSNPGYLEGNAVEGPQGEIYDVVRFNSMPQPGNKAILLQYDPPTNALHFKRVLDLPGGHTKFVIHRDPVTHLYLTLSNNNTVVGDPDYFDQRNVLTLCSSPDVENWTMIGPLLTDDTGFPPTDSVRFTGFHYVDWHIDGNDILYVVRTAYRGAVSYHNSNRITFKKLSNFRRYLPGGDGGAARAKVHLSNFSLAPLVTGAVAYSNRPYVWNDVAPSLLRDPPLMFTRLAGGVPMATISATVTMAGTLYVGTADAQVIPALEAAGFEALDPMLMTMSYTDGGHTMLRLYAQRVEAGMEVKVPQGGWAGCVLIGDLVSAE